MSILKHDSKVFKTRQSIKIASLSLVIFCLGCSFKKEYVSPIVYDQGFQQALVDKNIAVVAPGSGTEPEKIERLKSIAQIAFNIPDELINNDNPLHSNTDEKRSRFLKNALYKNSNDIIWCLRGGYGSARVIDKLQKTPKPKHEKFFIGYSDVTAIHLFLSQNWNWKTIYGAGLVEILYPEKDPENFRKISEIVSHKVSTLELTGLQPLNDKAMNSKKITGSLTGGNLTIVQSSIGTGWQIKTEGKILFLEDIKEYGYKIDRMLNHLKQAGLLDKVKGIIFGDFSDSQDEYVTFALERFAFEINIPVYKTDKFGHGTYNYPLIYNSKAKIIRADNSKVFSLIMRLN